MPSTDHLDEANMADAISIGELLIDFVPVTTGTDLLTATAFHKAAGGAPANVAVALARLGVSSALMGKPERSRPALLPCRRWTRPAPSGLTSCSTPTPPRPVADSGCRQGRLQKGI